MLSAPSPFPLYLLPSIPFRRRRSSTETTNTVNSDISTTSSSPPAGAAAAAAAPAPTNYLRGNRSHLRCTRCLTDLCLTSQIISKGFTGRHGRAYLVAPPRPYPDGTTTTTSAGDSAVSHRDNNLPNTFAHKPVPRQLVTGAHTVSDISCALCGAVLGWKYVAADEDSQKYKVGKFILETKRVCRGVCWENEDADGGAAAGDAASSSSTAAKGAAAAAVGDASSEGEDVEFDSQNEDECEDLFAGVWSPALAKRRRRGRAWREGRNGAGGVEEV
ncbi:yippee family protein [Diplodia corticola]|uniref:Yippee family protein n=1 Tax=Diplodia corticola TaxID=236234 RepID=A0A1J9R636_9PEZI|nr:yippee family protein [Diplodia corticola]OJD36982.1 yippee family protein [Diplodia corticola]